MGMGSMVSIFAQAELDLITTVGEFVNKIGIGLAFVSVIIGTFIYLLPVIKENYQKKGKAFDNLAEASINLVKLSEAHKERIDKVDDELVQHHGEFTLCGKNIEERLDTHNKMAIVACKALRQYLNDESFPEDKQKYLMYVGELEDLAKHNG